jgi:hypothetical protein
MTRAIELVDGVPAAREAACAQGVDRSLVESFVVAGRLNANIEMAREFGG